MAIKRTITKKSLPKAQPGLSVTTGTNPKNNANAKLAAGIGAAMAAVGLALEKRKKKKAAKAAAKAKNPEDVVEKRYGGSTKKRK